MIFVLLQLANAIPPAFAFPLTFLWLTSIFYLVAFGIGNMNALALEPLGHMAGLAASVITALATVGAGLMSVPIGLAFNGTVLPLTVGIGVLVALALVVISQLEADVPAAG